MSKSFWYSVLRPGWNRYYADRRLYKIAYILRFIPAAIGLTIMAILWPSWIYIPVILAVVVLALLDYFVFDMIIERVWWSVVFKRFYENKDENSEYDAIKQYDRNPNADNRNTLKSKLDKLKEN